MSKHSLYLQSGLRIKQTHYLNLVTHEIAFFDNDYIINIFNLI